MSSFEIGASRPVGAVQVGVSAPVANGPAPSDSAAATPTTSAVPEVTTSLNTSAGAAPVDQDRVSQIREAVQNGTYPVVPAKISDAMIAAGALLRKVS